ELTNVFLVRRRPSPQDVQQVGPSIQAGAALAPGISQQAFKKETDIGVACVIPARATPTSKIPIEGSGSGDEVRKSCVKRAREVRPCLRLRHGISPMLWARRAR